MCTYSAAVFATQSKTRDFKQIRRQRECYETIGFNEQNNARARALKILAHFFAVLGQTNRRDQNLKRTSRAFVFSLNPIVLCCSLCRRRSNFLNSVESVRPKQTVPRSVQFCGKRFQRIVNI